MQQENKTLISDIYQSLGVPNLLRFAGKNVFPIMNAFSTYLSAIVA